VCSKLRRTFWHIKRQRLPSPLHDQAYSMKCWDAQTCSLLLDVVTTSSLYSGSPFKLRTVFSFLPPLNANALFSLCIAIFTYMIDWGIGHGFTVTFASSQLHSRGQGTLSETVKFSGCLSIIRINSSAGTIDNDRLLRSTINCIDYLGSLPYFNSTSTFIYLLCEDWNLSSWQKEYSPINVWS